MPSRLRPVHAAVVLITGAALAVSACSATTAGTPAQSPSSGTSSSSSASATAPSSPAAPSTTAPPKKTVHISLLNADGQVFGIGMPEIAYFSRHIRNAEPLQKATTVTVNGQPAQGAWYFERSAAGKGPVEGHFRLEHYWPAHSKIHISIPAKGLSAGGNMVYDDSLTSDWSTGASHIATVDDSTHQLTLVSDGKKEGTYPVSLGAPNTPTARGTKVIMEKGVSICMSGPGYSECGIKYTQRLTYGGEYLHSAPWNVAHIEEGIDSSNGCTNLLPNDAEHLYNILRIGDVVTYPNANGPAMTMGAGYGDWNVPWTEWQQGGYVPTA